MNDIVTNAIDRNCIVTGDCKNTDYSEMQNCINDLRVYNDMIADKCYYQQLEELQELRKENKQLKEQLEQKENEIKELCKKIKVNEKSRRKMQKSLMETVQKSEKARNKCYKYLKNPPEDVWSGHSIEKAIELLDIDKGDE